MIFIQKCVLKPTKPALHKKKRKKTATSTLVERKPFFQAHMHHINCYEL